MEAFLNSSRVGGKVRFPCFTAELNETSHFSTSRSSPWCVIVCPLFLPHSLFLKHAPHSPEQFSICLQVTYPLRGSEASLFPFPTTDHSQTCSLPGQINGGEREIIRFILFVAPTLVECLVYATHFTCFISQSNCLVVPVLRESRGLEELSPFLKITQLGIGREQSQTS